MTFCLGASDGKCNLWELQVDGIVLMCSEGTRSRECNWRFLSRLTQAFCLGDSDGGVLRT